MNKKKALFFTIFLLLCIFSVIIFITDFDKEPSKKTVNSEIFQKQNYISLTVNYSNVNRGAAIFENDYERYYIFSHNITNSADINKVLYINPPYKLIKEKYKDTIWLINQDTTLFMILK